MCIRDRPKIVVSFAGRSCKPNFLMYQRENMLIRKTIRLKPKLGPNSVICKKIRMRNIMAFTELILYESMNID